MVCYIFQGDTVRPVELVSIKLQFRRADGGEMLGFTRISALSPGGRGILRDLSKGRPKVSSEINQGN